VALECKRMPVITLLTDFGTCDTYVGQMKGVLHAMASHVTVVDLTHHVPPQDVLAAAIHLDAAADAFADDTIHVAVVDPGVGGARRGIALRNTRGSFVGPDNGLFSAVLERYPAKAIVCLEDHALFRKTISDTFHGRDIFAPAAAHLANGVHLTEFGPLIDDPVTLDLPRPTDHDDGSLTAHVLIADHFGNLITDLRREAFDAWRDGRPLESVRIHLPDTAPLPLSRTFADTDPGQPVAYFGSSGRLELAVRNGSAKQCLSTTEAITLRCR